MANIATTHVGIKIFSPTGSGPQGTPDKVIFTTKYPFAKLDSQNTVSFQNISIFFNTDPPNPIGGGTITTPVYQFAHGYKYIPTYWVLYQNLNAPNDPAHAAYGNEGSVIFAESPSAQATLEVRVDDTLFYIDVKKIMDPLDPDPPSILGFTVKLRVYVFTEPVVLS